MNDEQCIDWIYNIINQEKLSDWRVQLKNKAYTEGYVWRKSKIIELNWPENEPSPSLALHEIAHVKTIQSEMFDTHAPHDSHFAHVYMKLVKNWMVPKS